MQNRLLRNVGYFFIWGDFYLLLFGVHSLFVPGQPAVYYVRVLEIPTPRWTLYDKVRYGLDDLPVNTPLTIQERAYTSAIWLIP